jgi:hypothetical protein
MDKYGARSAPWNYLALVSYAIIVAHLIYWGLAVRDILPLAMLVQGSKIFNFAFGLFIVSLIAAIPSIMTMFPHNYDFVRRRDMRPSWLKWGQKFCMASAIISVILMYGKH